MGSESTRTSRPRGRPKVTVAVPDLALRGRIRRMLGRTDVAIERVEGDADSLQDALSGGADVVLVRRSEWVQLGEERQGHERPAIVVVEEDDDPGDRARLVAAGAAGVLPADPSADQLGAVLATAAVAELHGGRARPDGAAMIAEPRLADFHSRSPRMRAFLDVVERIKHSDSTLLISGETGVGKERLARAIHAESPRQRAPFVSVNCGALPEQLLESELFGHEKGSFTGAHRRKPGRFELADGGTIFLDEIGEMPKHLQVNLLTVLQRREVRPIGSDTTVPVDVRVMAATHRELRECVSDGTFREDLFYRLHVLPLRVPPLRERAEDLPDLVGAFVRHLRDPLDRSRVEGFDDDAMAAMLGYAWPGNVRELVNVVERGLLLCQGQRITRAELPEEIASGSPMAAALSGGIDETWLDLPLPDARAAAAARFERDYLTAALKRAGGRIGETARIAGIHVRSLHDRMKKLGLRKEDYR